MMAGFRKKDKMLWCWQNLAVNHWQQTITELMKTQKTMALTIVAHACMLISENTCILNVISDNTVPQSVFKLIVAALLLVMIAQQCKCNGGLTFLCWSVTFIYFGPCYLPEKILTRTEHLFIQITLKAHTRAQAQTQAYRWLYFPLLDRRCHENIKEGDISLHSTFPLNLSTSSNISKRPLWEKFCACATVVIQAH